MSDPRSGEPLLPETAWRQLLDWYRENGRHHLPWRACPDPWGILVAEILLHRTRADTVARIFPDLVARFPDPEAVVREPDEWQRWTRPMGLHWRSALFQEACRALVADHGGQIPAEKEALMALPGIGQYVAAAVRVFGFGIPDVLIDANTLRLAGRVTGETIPPGSHRTIRARRLVGRLGPEGNAPGPASNYALLDLAGILCRTGEPDCSRCPIRSWCATGRALTGSGASTS